MLVWWNLNWSGGSSLSFFLEVANLIAVLYLHENGSNPRALGRVIMWATPSRDEESRWTRRHFGPPAPLPMEEPPSTLWLLARGPVERQARLEMGQRLIPQTKYVGIGVLGRGEKRGYHHPEQGAGQIAYRKIVA